MLYVFVLLTVIYVNSVSFLFYKNGMLLCHLPKKITWESVCISKRGVKLHMWKIEVSWNFIYTEKCPENEPNYPTMEKVLEKSESIYSMGRIFKSHKKIKIKMRHLDRRHFYVRLSLKKKEKKRGAYTSVSAVQKCYCWTLYTERKCMKSLYFYTRF